MVGPLSFHSKLCWNSGIVDCPLMGGTPPLCWAIFALGWCLEILGMGPLGHMA